jgi:hypothetical protein
LVLKIDPRLVEAMVAHASSGVKPDAGGPGAGSPEAAPEAENGDSDSENDAEAPVAVENDA